MNIENTGADQTTLKVFRLLWTIPAVLLTTAVASGGEVSVLHAKARLEEGGTYRIEVTLRHDDTGWDHYADRWDVLSPEGDVLATRVLLHPHVQEQPFTRSLAGVEIPPGLKSVLVKAHDKVHGDSAKLYELNLPSR